MLYHRIQRENIFYMVYHNLPAKALWFSRENRTAREDLSWRYHPQNVGFLGK